MNAKQTVFVKYGLLMIDISELDEQTVFIHLATENDRKGVTIYTRSNTAICKVLCANDKLSQILHSSPKFSKFGMENRNIEVVKKIFSDYFVEFKHTDPQLKNKPVRKMLAKQN